MDKISMNRGLLDIAQLSNSQRPISAEQLQLGKEGGALDSKKAEEAAQDFEALLLQQMFQAMWRSVPTDGMLSGSREEELYRDMLNEELAKQLSEGQSIGIKEVILNDLKRREGI
jgi:peptidoglycan hydrolase FlgJ